MRICQDEMTRSYDIVEFDGEVDVYKEDLLWVVRGNTLLPAGTYRCSVETTDGAIIFASFAPT